MNRRAEEGRSYVRICRRFRQRTRFFEEFFCVLGARRTGTEDSRKFCNAVAASCARRLSGETRLVSRT